MKWNLFLFLWTRNKTQRLHAIKKHLKVLHNTRVVDHFEGWQDGRSGGWSGFLQEGCHINNAWTFVQLSFEELCDKQEKKAPESPLQRWRRKKGQSRHVWVIFTDCQQVPVQSEDEAGFFKTFHCRIKSVFTTLNWKSVGNVSQTPGWLWLWTGCSKDSADLVICTIKLVPV